MRNDNKARLVAFAMGIAEATSRAFLLACKLAGLANSAEIRKIIDDLLQKDFYKFRQDIQARLLAE